MHRVYLYPYGLYRKAQHSVRVIATFGPLGAEAEQPTRMPNPKRKGPVFIIPPILRDARNFSANYALAAYARLFSCAVRCPVPGVACALDA